MAELKITCPKCGGHVAFPKEIAGHAAACPHCQEPIVLGSKSRVLLWTLLGIGSICVVIALAALFWHLGNGSRMADPVSRPLAETTRGFEKKANTGVAEAAASADDRAIEALCRAFYERHNEKDFEAIYQMVAAPCKTVVTPAVLEKGDVGNVSYRFVGIDSVTYLDGPAGKLAKARIRRVGLGETSEAEGVREFKCVKERGGWKLFRDFDWMAEIVSDFERSGFTELIRTNVHLFCASNPFDKWPADETNAFEKIYGTIYEGTKEVFPWNLTLTIETNYFDGRMLKVVYSIHNHADRLWEPSGLDLNLKQGGKVVLSTIELIPAVGAGSEVRREASFFLKRSPQESTRYDLDVTYTMNRHECQIASGIPVELSIPRLADSVKFDVVRTWFDLGRSIDNDDIWLARIDYRIKNVDKQALENLSLRFVWSKVTGEIVSESTANVVGFGDLPFEPQKTKTGFTRCGIGNTLLKTLVKADVYVEQGTRRFQVITGLVIRSESAPAQVPITGRPARPAFEVLSVTARVTEKNNMWWRFGYRLIVRNNAQNAEGQSFKVQFLDVGGFVVDTTTSSRTVIKPGTSETITGDRLINLPGAARVAKYKAVLY